MKTLTARKLVVHAQPMNGGEEKPGHAYTFPVWEFPNGAVLVPSDTTNDWWFQDRHKVEACGCDVILRIEETETQDIYTSKDIGSSIKGSISEFGRDSIPESVINIFK
jgi:hypothetical protein